MKIIIGLGCCLLALSQPLMFFIAAIDPWLVTCFSGGGWMPHPVSAPPPRLRSLQGDARGAPRRGGGWRGGVPPRPGAEVAALAGRSKVDNYYNIVSYIIIV